MRIGTVRRPPRGVRRHEFASRDFYDVWFPNLAPSEELLKEGIAAGADERAWRRFSRRFLVEMRAPGPSRDLDLLAALSRRTHLAIGCYCADESRCHRSMLRDLLLARGAEVEDG